jgi:hypothetical protein
VKFISAILSLYILALTIVPCCLFDNCPEDKTEQFANHEQGDDDFGVCSPFFNCEGCAVATVNAQSIRFELNPVLSTPVYAGYRLPSLPEADFDFWQPPQLV